MKLFICILSFIFFSVPIAHAEQVISSGTTKQVRATITEVIQVNPTSKYLNQYIFRAKTVVGDLIDVDTSESIPSGIPIKLTVGKEIFLQVVDGSTPKAYFEDVVRTRSLWFIVALFVITSLIVGLKRGLLSLFGLGITLLVLFGYIFPSILQGRDVITVTIIGSVVILAVNMHIAHGFRKESFLAFLSTVIGLLLAWLFSSAFSLWTSINGMGSEDALLLVGDLPVEILTIRLFIAGAILGTVGVLDDIAVSQTEIVHELRKTDTTLTRKELFLKAMGIGRHHIASTVNTLVLVYAGASMPILILFLYHSVDIVSFMNSEVVTEEFVRTIAGTMALILTVPISTFIALWGRHPKSLDIPHKHT
jgi:uncharacterized membrane protein